MGSLPASTEIVLEIQLNKLIRDYLFSGTSDGNARPLWNGITGGRNANHTVETETHSCDTKAWKLNKTFVESTRISYDVNSTRNAPSPCGDLHAQVPGVDDDQSRSLRPSYELSSSLCSPTGEIRLNMHDQTSNLCIPQHAKTLKLVCLSKSHSTVGSLFCFSTKKQGENQEKQVEDRASASSMKLTRIGSLPCHSKLHGEGDNRYTYTCQKPPRPPKSSLEKSCNRRDAPGDTVLVLRGVSKQARLERRKRPAGVSSSNASMWALIFTLFFALAILRGGFRSRNSTLTSNNSSRSLSVHGTMASSNTKSNFPTASMETSTESGPYVSSQLEKDMQMHEFWMSRGLDPS